MAEITPADLSFAPSSYQSSRAVSDVLIGHDNAISFFEAASTGDVAALRRILEDAPEIALESPHRIYHQDRPARDKDDLRRVDAMKLSNIGQAILRAAQNGHVAAVSLLLEFASRCSLEPSSVIDRNTVKMTIQNRHNAVFDVLAAADSTIINRSLGHMVHAPLDLALKTGNIELFRRVLELGGGQDGLRQPPEKGWGHRPGEGSRLAEAARRSKTMVELLLQHGYTIKGSGALQCAAEKGNLDIVRFLLDEHGADVNERLPAKSVPRREDSLFISWTPMHFAAVRSQVEAMKLLESYGAKADVLDEKGRTPWQLMEEQKRGAGSS